MRVPKSAPSARELGRGVLSFPGFDLSDFSPGTHKSVCEDSVVPPGLGSYLSLV